MTDHTRASTPVPEPVPSMPRTRRALLLGAVGSVAALVASRFGSPEATSAAAGDPLIIGNTGNTAGMANTTLATTSTGTALLVNQLGTGTALRGSAVGPNSIAGFFTATNGTGVSGVTGRDSSFGVYGANDSPNGFGGAAVRAAGQQNHGLVATTSNNLADAVRAVQSANGTAVRATATTGVAVQASGGPFGVSAEAAGIDGNGVYGLASSVQSGTGVKGESNSPAGRGVHGIASAGVNPIAVLGETQSDSGIGVQGTATGNGTGVRGESTAFIGVRGTGGATGVHGQTVSTTGAGVKGVASAASGATTGVHGEVASPAGVGVRGITTAGSGIGAGVHGSTNSSIGIGVRGDATSLTGNNAAIYGQNPSTGGIAVFGMATAATGNVFGLVGETVSVPEQGLAAGAWGASNATTGEAVGVYGTTLSTGDSAGVFGWALASSGTASGVAGVTSSDDGVGVLGIAGPSPSIGVLGRGTGNGFGVFCDGRAEVTGSLDVGGMLTKGGGSFKIDHPLDPANKFLSHSFVESPDMKNIYDGVAKLDGNGEATVELPDWFEALNHDVRYQLTPIGEYAPLFVRSKVKSGRFAIAGGAAGQEVSWQVTGIRKDAWAEAHRIPVEEDKKGDVKGRYLHPEEHGQKASKGIKLPKAAQRALTKAPKAPKAPKLAS